jgi:hypothetical protein
MAINSIWFVTSDGGCSRFDLSGNPLEVLQELPGCNVGEGNAPNHHSPHLRRLVPDGLLRAETCERYDEIAVYKGNSGNITRKNLLDVLGVVQRWFLWLGHTANLLWPRY